MPRINIDRYASIKVNLQPVSFPNQISDARAADHWEASIDASAIKQPSNRLRNNSLNSNRLEH
jgi:hypothetical protein